MNDPIEVRESPRIEDVFALLERAGYAARADDQVQVERGREQQQQQQQVTTESFSSSRRGSEVSVPEGFTLSSSTYVAGSFEARHCWRPDPVASFREQQQQQQRQRGIADDGAAGTATRSESRKPNFRISVPILLGALFAFTFVRVAVAFVFSQMEHNMSPLSHGFNSSIIAVVAGATSMMTLVHAVAADGWLGREPTLFYSSILRVLACTAVLISLVVGGWRHNLALEATTWIAQFTCNGEMAIMEALIREQ